MRILKRTLMYFVMTFIDETEYLITHHTIFKIYSWQFCISNVPMHSISDPLKTQWWNLGCTWHCIARTVEFENTSDNSCTPRQTDAKKASSVAEGERRNRWEIQRERRKSKKWRGWRNVAFSKGTYRGWYFILGPQAPLPSTSSTSSQFRWCCSCRTAVSSASKRGSRPGLMDFTTPWGPDRKSVV